MQPKRRLRTVVKVGAGLSVGALLMAALGFSSATGATSAKPAIHKGGTAAWAQAPAATPNYIFPFASFAYFSVANLTQFQYLMYRPLYWFGQISSSNPTFDQSLSLADGPTYSNGGKTVTIHLKGWKYSNGQVVDAQSVIFWLNMMKAEGPSEWAGYAPTYWPDNLVAWSAKSPTSLNVTIHMNSAYATNWLLYNELSQITPMPQAWDITSLHGKPGSGGCSKIVYTKAVAAACTNVWTFDTDNNGKASNPQMAGDLKTYGTNPVWQVVDGPWRLSSFHVSPGGNEPTFVPNPKYSGPQKPYLSKFIEVPFTSDTAEFAAIRGRRLERTRGGLRALPEPSGEQRATRQRRP